jgi:hypothetical protein
MAEEGSLMETAQSWSRRALLAGAASGAAALAATVIAPGAALAGSDGDVVLGTANPTTSPTTITNSTADQNAFAATASGDGVALEGSTTNGVGVHGVVSAPTGLSGVPTGVKGEVAGGDIGFGVIGTAEVGVSGAGVIGVAGDSQTIGGAGILGYGEAIGCGVYGAVGGNPPAGPRGVGVYAVSTEPGLTALRVDGGARFSRSGRLSVAKGKSSVSKSVAGMTRYSLVLATLQSPVAGTWVASAVAGTGTFTVRFNRALPAAGVVGWFVIN